jgi:hypothetical protein
MYGDHLECDTLTVAHHGNIGSEIALYKLAEPTAVWYPNHGANYNNYTNSSRRNEWPYNVSYYLVNKLESLKYVYVAGMLESEGNEAITLTTAADGSFDYAITFNDDVFNSIVSTNSNFPVYVDRGEYYEITISPNESGLWEMMSYANADTYGELCNSNGDVICSDDDGAGFCNNFKIQYYLEAGETYILRVRWYNSSRIGAINVSIQCVAEKA